MSCLVLCRIVLCLVLFYLHFVFFVPWLVLSWFALPCLVLVCLALPCLVLSNVVLPCLVCLVSSFLGYLFASLDLRLFCLVVSCVCVSSCIRIKFYAFCPMYVLSFEGLLLYDIGINHVFVRFTTGRLSWGLVGRAPFFRFELGRFFCLALRFAWPYPCLPRWLPCGCCVLSCPCLVMCVLFFLSLSCIFGLVSCFLLCF